jgi:hypothetical protein
MAAEKEPRKAWGTHWLSHSLSLSPDISPNSWAVQHLLTHLLRKLWEENDGCCVGVHRNTATLAETASGGAQGFANRETSYLGAYDLDREGSVPVSGSAHHPPERRPGGSHRKAGGGGGGTSQGRAQAGYAPYMLGQFRVQGEGLGEGETRQQATKAASYCTCLSSPDADSTSKHQGGKLRSRTVRNSQRIYPGLRTSRTREDTARRLL